MCFRVRTIYRNKCETGVQRIRPLVCVEKLQVAEVCELFEIPSQGNLILVVLVRLVTSNVVDLLETGDCNIVGAIRVDPSSECRGH